MPSATRQPQLSKTRFVSGSQCHNKLWWEVREPDAPELELSPAVLDIFEQGNQVGELARAQFPGGVLIDPRSDRVEDRLAATKAALDEGPAAIFEATFVADGVVVAVDVLDRTRDGVAVVEVKSSSSVKDEHIPDAAIQAHVLRRNGIDIRRVEIMHLNREYRCPGVGGLLVREDVTERVFDFLDRVPEEVRAQLSMLAGDFPNLPLGEQCAAIGKCPFMRRCWPDDSGHVLRLRGKGIRKVLELMEQGIHYIQDIPERIPLPAINQRQRRAIEGGGLVAEPGLYGALQGIESPVGFLDFETVSRAIPVWDGLAPWGAAPVQFSYHERLPDGEYRHVEWLAQGPADPRPAIARALVDACSSAGSIVVYTSFEATQIRRLKQAVPDLGLELDDIERRLFDLHRVVKDNIYHEDFGGSLSIKRVLPVLVPDLGYDDLRITDGQDASAEIARLLFRESEFPEVERRELRKNLLAYCERDTWAMVKLLERLTAIATTS